MGSTVVGSLEPDFPASSSRDLPLREKAPNLNTVSDESKNSTNESAGRRTPKSHRRTVLTIGLLLLAIGWLGTRSLKPIDPNNISTPTIEVAAPPTPTPLPSQFPNIHPESEPQLPGEDGSLDFVEAVAQCWPNRKPEEPLPEDLTLVHLSQVFGRLLKNESMEENEDLELPDGRIRRLATKGTILTVLESDEDGLPHTKVNDTDLEKLSKSAREKLYESHRKGATKVAVEKFLGLLFDSSFFPQGAAGTATEINGEIRDLMIRAEGRMIKCTTPATCDCQ